VERPHAPWDAAFDPDGRLYYAADDGGIWRGYPTGPFERLVTSGFVQGFAVDPADNDVYASIGGDIYRFSGIDGRMIGTGPVVSGVGARFVTIARSTGPIPIGHQPGGVAVDPVANRVYVANEEGSSIDVIDGSSNTLITSVHVGPKPRHVAVDPEAKRVYVTRYFCRCVSVVDAETNLPIGDVPVAGNPVGIAVNSTTGRVYVATLEDRTQGGSFDGLVVIDAATNTVVAAAVVGATPVGVAVNPDTSWVYVTSAGSSTISVLDAASLEVLATIPVSGVSDDVVVNPATGQVYAPNPLANTVEVIDGAPGSPTLHSVVGSIAVGKAPISVAIDAGMDRVYVGNGPDRTVSVIDGATRSVIGTIAAGGTRGIIAANGGLAVNSTTHRGYVSHQQEDFITVFDPASQGPPQPPADPNLPDGTISGRVLDPSGGGVGGATVLVCPVPRPGFAFICAPFVADASGSYVSPRLAPGLHDVKAFPPQNRPDLGTGVLLNVNFVGGVLTDQDVRLPAAKRTSTGVVAGRVTDAALNGVPGARVQACRRLDILCGSSAMTDTLGRYRIEELPPGTYDLKAFPPAGSSLMPGHLLGLVVVPGAVLDGRDLRLMPPGVPPGDTGIDPDWPDDFHPPHLPGGFRNPTLVVATCPGAQVRYFIDQAPPKILRLAEGLMTEDAKKPGSYSAVAVYPWNSPNSLTQFLWFFGHPFEPISSFEAVVGFRVTCPDGSSRALDAQVYIDPSGTVKTTTGIPIAGATVTLSRSETGSLESFEVVPDGDVVMSPFNRRNPDRSDTSGRFGWDVLTGFYVVRAEKDGCTSEDGLRPFVETPILAIPPAVIDLDLRLFCPTRVLSRLGSAEVFVGVANSDDNGRRVDLLVEVYKNGILVGQGARLDTRVFGNALASAAAHTVPLTIMGDEEARTFLPGDTLSSSVFVRRRGGSGNVKVKLWYGGTLPPPSVRKGWSRFAATLGDETAFYYYRSGSPLPLSETPGPAGVAGTLTATPSYQSFGTWSVTIP
jgi:YVTN family beta-propeller protein